MKKIVALLLVLVCVLSMAACGGKKEPEAEKPTTPATILAADFKAQMKDGAKGTEEIANALIENEVIPFMGAVMPVDEGFLNGFQTEITGFEEAAMFAPMIGSIPFIGYVFNLADDADVDAFVKNLEENADLRWNVCTEADEMVSEVVDKTVYFCMSPLKFED